ncbi:ABC transporter ATP-binding protein [Corynebacterium sphenisci]|uniref:ABC transporter ATP-binding protein n=1 Tax=Corynebacterium sphenisci TaxID=191493 RepID=UPI0026E0CAA0|nr:ABC transporter ATP-binding protein [Corynebacterium sphenisci]MDO5731800.1 ABC transporter ATP-binding protein [Corynebacterium sphenisci]
MNETTAHGHGHGIADWRDPLLLGRYRAMMTPAGRRLLTRALALHALGGVLEGLGLLALLPAATVLATGAPALGLGLAGWLWALAGLALAAAVLRYAQARVGYAAAIDFLRTGHHAIGDQLARLPLGWFTKERTGGLSRLMSDGFMAAAGGVAHIMPEAVSSAFAVLTLILGGWFWDPRIGLTLTLLAPVALGTMIAAQALKRAKDRPMSAAQAELSARLVEYAACQPALRAAGRAEDFAPLAEACARVDRARWVNMWWSLLALTLNGIVVQAFVVLLITGVAALAVSGDVAPVQAVAFIGLTLRFSRSLDTIGRFVVSMEIARPPLEEAGAIIGAPGLPEPDPAAAAARTAPGRVEFDRVGFGYDPDHPVLRDLSFTAEPGTMTALVGPSGCGKTTVHRLISRFWDVDSGTVRVDGADIRELPTETLMAQLSLVFQDVYLFDDTLEANIRVGRPEATAAEVRAAADLAGVTAIAERLPGGWAAKVGEGGRGLSGGERQRVSIARALLKRAPIVLFDEATSALDAENEANVLASVETLRAESTFIVIAHRLDTIRDADRIIVLDEHGRVAETGTHEQLHAAGGAYRRFWDRREAATGWTLAG